MFRFGDKMVRKGKKQNNAAIVGTNEVQRLVVMFGVVAILRLDLREKRLHSRILENTAIKSPLEC